MIGGGPEIQANWDWRAAGNFIGGGTGSGLLILGGVGPWNGPALPTPVTMVALALVALGLALVWLEIGRPLRFLHVFFNPQTSWMTRESLVAIPLFALGGLAIWFDDPWLFFGAGAVSLGFLFCQGRILTAAKGIPAWREPMVTPLIMTTGVTEGAGLLSVAMMQTTGGGDRWLLNLLLFLLVLRLLVWLGYRWRLDARGAPAKSLASLRAVNRWFIPVGFAMPVIGIATALALAPGSEAPWLVTASGALAVAGGWLLKYGLVTKAGHTQGFALPLSPVRGQGRAGPGARPGWD